MKLLALFTAILLTVNASTDWEQWVTFKQTHGRTYKSLVEERTRFGIFQDTLRRIEQHNARYNKGEVTYYLGVTRFADQTQEEFMNKLKLQASRRPTLNTTRHVFEKNLQVPESIDWTEKGADLGVKDQGDCGSCWAFSATGSLEGQNAILHNITTPLSEQQLIDCSGSYGNNACNGGVMNQAFDYVKDHGIAAEENYPYVAKKTSCKADAKESILQVYGYKDIEPNEEALRIAVGTIGPISVAIDASLLKDYKGGILSGQFCLDQLNHGALVVGYGTDNYIETWKLKNSWGSDWGEEGYFKLARNADTFCGLTDMASYPVIR